MNAFYLVGLAVAGIILLKKKPGNTVITIDPIDVKPIPYSPTVKPVSTKLEPGYYGSKPTTTPPEGTVWKYVHGMSAKYSGWTAVPIFDISSLQDWTSAKPLYQKLQGLNEYTE